MEQVPHGIALDTILRFVDIGTDALSAAREEIDALNVYPVPDGDTGTNMFLTFSAARDALRERAESGGDLGECLAAFRRGALMGARGNSGVILSQMLGAVAAQIEHAGPGRALCPGDGRGPAGGHGCQLRRGGGARRGHHADRRPGGQRRCAGAGGGRRRRQRGHPACQPRLLGRGRGRPRGADAHPRAARRARPGRRRGRRRPGGRAWCSTRPSGCSPAGSRWRSRGRAHPGSRSGSRAET